MQRWLKVLCLAPLLAGCASEPQVVLGSDASADPLQRHLVLATRLAGEMLKQGNRMTLLHDGAETLPAMFAAMDAARDSIDMEYYVFEDVHVGASGLGDLLVRKLAEGVTVNVIVDAYGSLGADHAFLDRLRYAGAAMLVFHPLSAMEGAALTNPNDRDHRTIMVVDGRVAFLGSVNLDRLYENKRDPAAAAPTDPAKAYYRDTDARIEGPAVADLQRLFFATWQHEGGPKPAERTYFPPLPPVGTQAVRIIGSSAGEGLPLYYVALLGSVHAAQQRIDLSTGYFVPTHQEREELARAARRGVTVRSVLPSFSDQPSTLAAGRAAYDDLLEAGVTIAEVQDAVLHSKFVTVDGAWTVVGSSNIDRRSVAFNNEVDAMIVGQETAAAAERAFNADVAAARLVTLAEWRRRPNAERENEFFSRSWEWLM
jgi:cardiolipin synthase A/B